MDRKQQLIVLGGAAVVGTAVLGARRGGLWAKVRPALGRVRRLLHIPYPSRAGLPAASETPAPPAAFERQWPVGTERVPPVVVPGHTVSAIQAESAAGGDRFVFAVREDQFSDRFVIDEVYVKNIYRLDDLGFRPRVAFDIGAHIGTFTVALKQRYPECEVYCFEPNKATFPLLQANAGRFAGVHLFNKAINYLDNPMLIESLEAAGAAGGALVSAGHELFQGGSEISVDGRYRIADEQVATTTLEDVFPQTGVQKVDIAKWDCEGGEIHAFRRMSDDSAARFGYMLGEYHEVEPVFTALVESRFPHHRLVILPEHKGPDFGIFMATPVSVQEAAPVEQPG